MNINKKTIQRFFRKVSKNKNGCWEWNCSRKSRYGKFSFSGKKYQAHRFSYFLETGYMPSEKEYICHRCDNTYCVNPSHLFIGSQQDNMNDMVSKGRSPDNHGDRNPKAKLSQGDVVNIRNLYSTGVSRQEISKMFNTPVSTIHKIASGNTWSHIKYNKPNIMPRNRKLTKEIEIEIKRLRKEKMSQDRIADTVGISQAVVSRVLLNQVKAWSSNE